VLAAITIGLVYPLWVREFASARGFGFLSPHPVHRVSAPSWGILLALGIAVGIAVGIAAVFAAP